MHHSENVPDFQDLTFKIYHPTKKWGVFSIFGIGGISKEVGTSGYVMRTNMGTLGISNTYTVNIKTFLKSIVAISGLTYSWDDEYNIGTEESPIDRVNKTKVLDYSAKASFTVNRKLNAQNKLKLGIVYDHSLNDSYMGWHSDTLFNWNEDPSNPDFQNIQYEYNNLDNKYDAGTIQTFLNWTYRITRKMTLNSGIHYLHFFLNNSQSLEPRLGFEWRIHPQHILSAGFGVHSRKESMTMYAGNLTLHDGTVIQPNMQLDLAKARHYVLGYRYLIGEYLQIKAEAYYQSLYDIPAFAFPPYLSTVNFDYGFEDDVLDNYGTAYNKGVELTLDKQLSRGFHFLLSGTLYDSKYIDKLGQVLHTKYDGRYGSNGIFR